MCKKVEISYADGARIGFFDDDPIYEFLERIAKGVEDVAFHLLQIYIQKKEVDKI